MNKQEKELMLEQIKAFEAKSCFKLEVKDGKPYHKGFLCSTSDYLPDNLVNDGGLKCFTGSKKLPKGLKVKGCLDISITDITEIPDDCEFGSLYMCSTRITKLRDNLTLYDLWTDNSFLKELPKNLVVFNRIKMSTKSINVLPNDCLVNRIDSKFDINDERYKKMSMVIIT